MGKSGRKKKFAARWAQSAYLKARKERERAPPTDGLGQAEGGQQTVTADLPCQTPSDQTAHSRGDSRPVYEDTTCDVSNRRQVDDLNDLSSNDGDTESGSDSSIGGDVEKFPSQATSPEERENHPQTTPSPSVPSAEPRGDVEKFPSQDTSPEERKDRPQTTPLPSVPSMEPPSSFIEEGNGDRIVLRLRRKSSSTDEGEERACPVGFERNDEYEVVTDTDSSSETRRSKHREEPGRRRRARQSPSPKRTVLRTDGESDVSATEAAPQRADLSLSSERPKQRTDIESDVSATEAPRAALSPSPKRPVLRTNIESDVSATEATTSRVDLTPSPERLTLRKESIYYKSAGTTETAAPRGDSPPPTQQRQCAQRKTHKGANSPLTKREARRRRARGKAPVNPETPWHTGAKYTTWSWKTSDESDASHSEGSWSNSGYETPGHKWERPARSLIYVGDGIWSTISYGKTIAELCKSPPPSPPTPPIPAFIRPFLLGKAAPPKSPPPTSPRSPRHPNYPLRHGASGRSKPMSFYTSNKPAPVVGLAGSEGGPLPSTSEYPDWRISKFEGFSTDSEEEQTKEEKPKRRESKVYKIRRKRKPKKRLAKGVKAPKYIFEKRVNIGKGHGIRYLAPPSPDPNAKDQPELKTTSPVYHIWTPPHTTSLRSTALDLGDFNEDAPAGVGTPPKSTISNLSQTGQGDDKRAPAATTLSPCDLEKAEVTRPEEASPLHHTSMPSTVLPKAASPVPIDISANVVVYGTLSSPSHTGQGDDRRGQTVKAQSPCVTDKTHRPEEGSTRHHTSLLSAASPDIASPKRVDVSSKVVAYGPLPQAIDACDTQAAWDTGSKTPSTKGTPMPDPWSETSSSEATDALARWYKKYLSQREPVPNPAVKVVSPTDFSDFLAGLSSNQHSDGNSKSSQPLSSQVQLPFKQLASANNSDNDASTSSSEGSRTCDSSSSSGHDSHKYQRKRKHASEGSFPFNHDSSSSDEKSRGNTTTSFDSCSSSAGSYKRRRHDDTSGLSLAASAFVTSNSDSNTASSSRSEGSSLSKGSCHNSNSNRASCCGSATSRGLKRKADDSNSPNPKRSRTEDSKSVSGGSTSDDGDSSSLSESRSSHSKGSGNNSRSWSFLSRAKGDRDNKDSHSNSSNSKNSRSRRSYNENSNSRYSNSQNISNYSDGNTDDDTNTFRSAFG
ncbi:serine/arginine repetitive matrix protein 1-like [Branchiostoma floridae]|uniref:Serine/arginine repetitive matrix protein 1-like n=1 Tax=Branchiostoma floridae TaxID=7739 RepID=A0A9J7MYY1_BRAFL|nr:serine/arginine repetitive matrix protein 1-like [Branchiostoma floridae]